MNTNKILISGLVVILFILLSLHAFAGTGGPKDGQMMLLVILGVLTVIFGILFFSPILVHWIRDLWKKYHHC